MSKSKAKNKDLKFEKIKGVLTSIVVDHTDTAFHIEKQSDDGGTHLMVYMPNEAKKNFDRKKFTSTVVSELGSVRVMICYVEPGYIENFLKIR
jgi:hypothetical protein